MMAAWLIFINLPEFVFFNKSRFFRNRLQTSFVVLLGSSFHDTTREKTVDLKIFRMIPGGSRFIRRLQELAQRKKIYSKLVVQGLFATYSSSSPETYKISLSQSITVCQNPGYIFKRTSANSAITSVA